MEAKKVNHPLDTVSKKETPGRFPHQQVRDYLGDATDQGGNPFRLAGEKYFCSYEDFKIFITLFRPEAFITPDGVCPLDDIRSEAIQYQTALEENLRKTGWH